LEQGKALVKLVVQSMALVLVQARQPEKQKEKA
jgi:hypothetical protein